MSSPSVTPRSQAVRPSVSSSSPAPPCRPRRHLRREPFPFSSLMPSFRANLSSTSLVPSTAEGRPIPVDDSTAEHCTSALREINHHYPSRHRYAKSTGAQSSTYSEPVIVRSYHPPVSGRPASTARTSTVRATVSGSDPFAPRSPFASKLASARHGILSTMAGARAKKSSAANDGPDAWLPPVEAFRFKSFMAGIEVHAGGGDINADLDRIAEICARSRYSLSNQYEVHYSPHGPGTSLADTEQQSRGIQGPTLLVVSTDDDRTVGRRGARRQPARRNSRAMGKLETIMSSSRSSDEGRSRQKSASEIADEIRGRASRKESGNTSPVASSRSTFDEASSQTGEAATRNHNRRPSASLAFIDSTRQNPRSGETTSSPRTPTAGLVSDPALPQESLSQLELRTGTAAGDVKEMTPTAGGTKAPGTVSTVVDTVSATGLLASLSGWVPWASSTQQWGRAEGSLRHLLRTGTKGNAVAVAGLDK
ncbi:hypothetical protein DCS_02630 [Drechmeria coniospora]|uniref:Uncharacterized protein n=1 Tax=Drechmeria coniospora TaxID=98403 RepID=A0A151GWL5_DRECN|nr:hypothetical protein DCS_02630 [Drechmeria coniospora]KYK61488.1 hypothetical protein DCS_02630 [Drechmeria coniospora]ODA79748.1 hypothetical protein RJ55_05342 [Drechmeria coniospora]